MQGHVRQRGKSWCIVIELERGPDGKRRQKWQSGFKTKGEAERELRTRLTRLDKGEDPFPVDVPVTAWVARWLEHLRTNHRVRPGTSAAYEQALRDHVIPHIGAMPMRKVRPAHVQSVLDQMTAAGSSPRTVEHARAALGACFQHAFAMDVILANVVRATRAPAKAPKPLLTPTGAELAAIATAAKGSRWEIPILLAATTGARRSEVLGLTWENVDLDAGRARIVCGLHRVDGELVRTKPKTPRGTRSVPLLPHVVARLRQHKRTQAERLLALGVRQDDSTPVCDRDGTPMDPSAFTSAAKYIAGKAGVPGVRLHDLRHGVITLLAAQGNAPEVTSMLAGHANVGFTLTRYTHPSDDRLDEAAARLSDALGG